MRDIWNIPMPLTKFTLKISTNWKIQNSQDSSFDRFSWIKSIKLKHFVDVCKSAERKIVNCFSSNFLTRNETIIEVERSKKKLLNELFSAWLGLIQRKIFSIKISPSFSIFNCRTREALAAASPRAHWKSFNNEISSPRVESWKNSVLVEIKF